MRVVENAFRDRSSRDRAGADLSIDEIHEAAATLDGRVRRTPLLSSVFLDARLGRRVLCKAECLQLTGSFKIRGALNKIRRLDPASRSRGVAAFSAGNHAQALAWAAREAGVRATIFMPFDAPETKTEKTRALGAHVIFYDRAAQDREALLREFVDRTGAIAVPPYDDRQVIAGGGTVALEFLQQIKEETGGFPDLLLVPCGGGGLVAGCATAAAHLAPETKVFAVEPEGFDDTAASLGAGRRLVSPLAGATICDALVTPRPGESTFPLNVDRLHGASVVEDPEVLHAMRVAFDLMQVVTEPGGAVGLAAALAWPSLPAGRSIGVVLTGGNVDPHVFARALAAPGLQGWWAPPEAQGSD